jgi:hypothetical protein
MAVTHFLSNGCVESAVNLVVSARFVKRQQMARQPVDGSRCQLRGPKQARVAGGEIDFLRIPYSMRSLRTSQFR